MAAVGELVRSWCEMNTKLFVVDDYDDAVPRRFSASGQVWMSISRGGGDS